MYHFLQMGIKAIVRIWVFNKGIV